MSDNGARKRGCAIAAVILVLTTVCSGGLAVFWALYYGPQWMAEAMVEDAPATFDHPSSPQQAVEITQRLTDELRATRTVRLTGPELTRLMAESLGSGSTGGISISDGVATFDLSFEARDAQGMGGWINVHAVGSGVVDDGWMRQAEISELEFSGWDLGSYLGDGPITDQVNQQIAKLRADDPDVADRLDTIERVVLEGDALVLTLHPEGLKYIRGPGE